MKRKTDSTIDITALLAAGPLELTAETVEFIDAPRSKRQARKRPIPRPNRP